LRNEWITDVFDAGKQLEYLNAKDRMKATQVVTRGLGSMNGLIDPGIDTEKRNELSFNHEGTWQQPAYVPMRITCTFSSA
jgi:hypothetical protein